MNCRLVANGALRKIGVLAAGREARAADLDDTFDALKALYRQLINNGTFGRLMDVVPVADYIAGENQRIFRNTLDVASITLPQLVETDCQELPPLDLSVVVIVDAFNVLSDTFIYEVPLREWVSIDGLTLDSEAPLSFRDPQGLQCLLAAQICDEYGVQIEGATQRFAGGFMASLTSRFSNPETVSPGVYY